MTWPSRQHCKAAPMPFPSSSLLGITFLVLRLLVRAIGLPRDSWETPRSCCQGNIKCLNEHIPVGTQPAPHLGPPSPGTCWVPGKPCQNRALCPMAWGGSEDINSEIRKILLFCYLLIVQQIQFCPSACSERHPPSHQWSLPLGSQPSSPVVLLMSPEPSEGPFGPGGPPLCVSSHPYSPFWGAPTEVPPMHPMIAKTGSSQGRAVGQSLHSTVGGFPVPTGAPMVAPGFATF